jgi:hypothetical protein
METPQSPNPDQTKKEWTTQLGGLVLIRVIESSETWRGEDNKEHFRYSFQVTIGAKVIAPEGYYDSKNEAFQAASDHCQNLFDQAQQDLIKTILKIKQTFVLPDHRGKMIRNLASGETNGDW